MGYVSSGVPPRSQFVHLCDNGEPSRRSTDVGGRDGDGGPGRLSLRTVSYGALLLLNLVFVVFLFFFVVFDFVICPCSRSPGSGSRKPGPEKPEGPEKRQ